MKKVCLFLIMTLAMVMPLSNSFAVEIEKSKNMLFGGINYDESVSITVGIGKQLSGKLWSFSYSYVGDYSSFNTEIGYVLFSGEKYYLAPIMGPNVDWLEPEESKPVLAYVVGAGGLIGAYDFTDNTGVWAYGKYKFKLENDILYPEGYVFGGGLFFRF